MCLGIPGRITDVWGDHQLINGHVDFGGVVKQVCLSYVPEARPGDYVIVHVGFAITMIDEEEAKRTLAILAEMGDLVGMELADATEPPATAGPPPGGPGSPGDTGPARTESAGRTETSSHTETAGHAESGSHTETAGTAGVGKG